MRGEGRITVLLTRRSCISTLAASSAAAFAAPMAVSSARAAEKISVLVMDLTELAPIYLGKTKGFFANQNLDVDITARHGGPMILSGVLAGEAQFGFSNLTSIFMAQEKGGQFVGVAPGSASTGVRGEDFLAIIAAANSPINNAKDLQNKTVGVNDPNNMGNLAVLAAVTAAGGDRNMVKFVQVNFPDMWTGITSHQIDAAMIAEPFITMAREQGAKVVDSPLVDIAPNMTMSLYSTTLEYANARPDIVKRFRAAILESLAYAQSHTGEVRKTIPNMPGRARIDAALAEKIVLPAWPTEINRPSIQIIADLALRDGIISKKADVATLLPQ
jgi:NitT/TauT family transport system substrate-binding protein